MLDDADMVDYLQRLVGYAITGEMSEKAYGAVGKGR